VRLGGRRSATAFLTSFRLGHDEDLAVGILFIGTLLAAENQKAAAVAEQLHGRVEVVLLDSAGQIRLVALPTEILPEHSELDLVVCHCSPSSFRLTVAT
jgi:hypothetical protein